MRCVLSSCKFYRLVQAPKDRSDLELTSTSPKGLQGCSDGLTQRAGISSTALCVLCLKAMTWYAVYRKVSVPSCPMKIETPWWS